MWNMSRRRIRLKNGVSPNAGQKSSALGGRISGAYRLGRVWAIPKNASKSEDERGKKHWLKPLKKSCLPHSALRMRLPLGG